MPALIEGTELVGEFQGSGYREPPHLVSRGDGQLVRLPALLYAIVRVLDCNRELVFKPPGGYEGLSQVADAVGRDTGIQLTPDQVAYLIDHKLAPLGVTTHSDGTPPPEVAKADPFLALKFKVGVIPADITWMIAGLFAWLFRPAIVVVALVVGLASEVWLFTTQDVALALRQTLVMPSSVLTVVALALVSTAFHEFGHAAACRYSGVRPGGMGCGLYLVWPVFYTDITSSYRLGRAGRLRTDLGGVYFNLLFAIGLAALYLWNGHPLLLVAIIATNMEIVQQLLPTLRFDGYFIVADLVGIPDLFRYIGPILRRSVLRQPADERLTVLKRWPQLVVTTWVLVVIPALAVQLVYMVVQLPMIMQAISRSITTLAWTASGGAGRDILGMASAVIQILVLLIPVVGVVLLILMMGRSVVRAVRRRYQRPPPRHALPRGRQVTSAAGRDHEAWRPTSRSRATRRPRPRHHQR